MISLVSLSHTLLSLSLPLSLSLFTHAPWHAERVNSNSSTSFQKPRREEVGSRGKEAATLGCCVSSNSSSGKEEGGPGSSSGKSNVFWLGFLAFE